MPLPGHPRIRNRQLTANAGVGRDALGALGISLGELTAMVGQLKGGRLVLPGWPEYEVDRQGNPLYPARPSLIVFAAGPEDVATALGWAQRHGWPVTLRSGGHSTAGYSLGDGMVLDVSLMNAVSVDPTAATAVVGSGASWGTINAALDTHGLHVPGGGCPSVGVAGYVQGGGYGFTSRLYGMSCDNVLAATVMLASGQVVVASPTRNKELFWAIRGGTGGNFGVLLDLTFGLVALRDVWGFSLEWADGTGAEALAALQAGFMGANGDPKVCYQVAIIMRGDTPADAQPVVIVLGMYAGTRDEGLAAIAPLRAVGSPTLAFDQAGTYAYLNEALFGLLPGVPEAPGQTTYEIKRSGYIATSLETSDWQSVLDAFATSPNGYNIIGIEPYGGAIRTPKLPNAFIHRDADMDLFVDSFYSDEWPANGRDAAQQWVDAFMADTAQYRNGEVYQNYPVRALEGWETAYFKGGYARLQAVKKAYDPGDFFRFQQGIVPAADAGGIVVEAGQG